MPDIRPGPREEPLEVQIALQGGGAKLFSLLVAMSEVERLEGRSKTDPQQPQIKVTHIAGTSAGAIVAALYAARVPMRAVLARLETLSLEQLLPIYSPTGRFTRVKTNLLHYLVKPTLRLSPTTKSFLKSYGINLGNMLLGYPAYRTDQLKEELRKIFNELSEIREPGAALPKWGDFRDVKIERFGRNRDSSIKLSVVRTELRTRKPYTARGEENLLNFLVDSAAIPFLLRNVQNDNWDLLDGGICANLPSQFLEENSRKIAIGFESPASATEVGPHESKWIRVIDLLDSAIDYSVERSIDQIGEENCCLLPATVSTFAFRSVLGAESKPVREIETKTVTSTTKAFFSQFIPRARVDQWLGGDPWRLARKNNEIAQALRRTLKSLGSLSPSTFPLMKIHQEFILHMDSGNPQTLFKSELYDERVIDAAADSGTASDRSPIRYLKTTLSYPLDAVLEYRSYSGAVGTEKMLLEPIPCLPPYELASSRREIDLERTMLFDLKPLLDVKRNLAIRAGRGDVTAEVATAIHVTSKIVVTGLIKDLFKSDIGGEEFVIDLGSVARETADISIKVHMPDRYLAACNPERTSGVGNLEKTLSCGLPLPTGPVPRGFGYVQFEANNLSVGSLAGDKTIGFRLLVKGE
jgi:predicted acylesterase/phospholipase RssA